MAAQTGNTMGADDTKAGTRVLSTLNADGTRRWINPKLSQGPLYRRRKVIGWLLIAVFVALPHIHVGGRQMFFLDVARGQFTLFGATFFRGDTLLFALTLVTIFLSIFLITAIIGRAWCGWACPQTVYLDFVFRPIDRFFDGRANKRGVAAFVSSLPGAVRGTLRLGVMLVVSFFLANTFLSYFVGSRTLLRWVTDWPWVHPAGFGFVAFVTLLMMINFAYFREQLCLIACPYGRFQSVLLDRHSIIVGYDVRRGEPRGKARRAKGDAPATVSLPVLGDCVDCGNCVTVCPTGIDIRNGLQLECINCAACIDACDTVMGKLGRAPGLIGYTSQAAVETGVRKLVRPRVFFYPALLLVLCAAIVGLLMTRGPADVRIVRGPGATFGMMPGGEVTNTARVRITNRTHAPHTYTLAAGPVEFRVPTGDLRVGPGETASETVLIVAAPEVFNGTGGHRVIPVVVRDERGVEVSSHYRLLGPERDGPVMNLADTTGSMP